MLIWPNLGERTVNVHLKPDLTNTEVEETSKQLQDYLARHYQDRFAGELTTIADDKGSAKHVFQVKGNFVQAAFLNELGRVKGVDGENIEVVPFWVEEKAKAKVFKLGLDLQGGMNLLMEADFDKLLEQINEQYSPEHIAELRKQIKMATDETKKKNLEFSLKQITDSMNLTPAKKKEYVNGALEIIRSRIDKTGVSEPMIRMQGDDKIEISLPGVASPQQAKKIIASTASVEYRLAEFGSRTYTQKAHAYFEQFALLDSEAQRKAFLKKVEKEIKLPRGQQVFVYWGKDRKDQYAKIKPRNFIILERTPSLTGKDMSPNTYVGFDQDDLVHTVNFQLTPEGTKKFAELTTANIGRQMAIVIDGKVRSAPRINTPILVGQAQISGDFSMKEAKDLALIIKEGALPVPMAIVEERSVGPSLGKTSIEKGVKAILFGLLGVAIFMVFYYHMAGLIAILALVFNVILMSAIMAISGFTITLPGLAGIVLTLGMIVDANVIIYERIREELARGKSFKLAVSQGFDRANKTILDANITTLLAAIVLTQFGVGPIKGFAVTLFVGILTSLFTSLYATRTLFYLLAYDFNIKSFSMGWKVFLRKEII